MLLLVTVPCISQIIMFRAQKLEIERKKREQDALKECSFVPHLPSQSTTGVRSSSAGRMRPAPSKPKENSQAKSSSSFGNNSNSRDRESVGIMQSQKQRPQLPDGRQRIANDSYSLLQASQRSDDSSYRLSHSHSHSHTEASNNSYDYNYDNNYGEDEEYADQDWGNSSASASTSAYPSKIKVPVNPAQTSHSSHQINRGQQSPVDMEETRLAQQYASAMTLSASSSLPQQVNNYSSSSLTSSYPLSAKDLSDLMDEDDDDYTERRLHTADNINGKDNQHMNGYSDRPPYGIDSYVAGNDDDDDDFFDPRIPDPSIYPAPDSPPPQSSPGYSNGNTPGSIRHQWASPSNNESRLYNSRNDFDVAGTATNDDDFPPPPPPPPFSPAEYSAAGAGQGASLARMNPASSISAIMPPRHKFSQSSPYEDQYKDSRYQQDGNSNSRSPRIQVPGPVPVTVTSAGNNSKSRGFAFPSR